MKRILMALWISVLCLSILPKASAAQTAEPKLRIEQVNSGAYPSIVLRLSVWDANGLPFADLTAADFTLQEDQGAPFHPAQISANSNSEISVALALDISGSMQGQPIRDARSAAVRFLDHLTPGDQAALIAFSDSIDPNPQDIDTAHERPFTDQFSELYDQIDGLQAAGGTHLYDALSKATRMTAALPQGRRAVLLLSDGRNDPPNQGDPQEAIQLAQAAQIPIFVIGLGNEIDEPYLRQVASETGGVFRAAPRSSELARLFEEMAALLKTEYQLTYTSTLPADGQAHQLQVQLDQEGSTALAETVFGPLPKTAQPTAASIPTQAPTAVTLVQSEITPAPVVPPTPEKLFPWQWLGLGGVLGLAAGIIFLRRKKAGTPEVCAKCGFDLSQTSGACPQCGETRRLPKNKRQGKR